MFACVVTQLDTHGPSDLPTAPGWGMPQGCLSREGLEEQLGSAKDVLGTLNEAICSVTEPIHGWREERFHVGWLRAVQCFFHVQHELYRCVSQSRCHGIEASRALQEDGRPVTMQLSNYLVSGAHDRVCGGCIAGRSEAHRGNELPSHVDDAVQENRVTSSPRISESVMTRFEGFGLGFDTCGPYRSPAGHPAC